MTDPKELAKRFLPNPDFDGTDAIMVYLTSEEMAVIYAALTLPAPQDRSDK